MAIKIQHSVDGTNWTDEVLDIYPGRILKSDRTNTFTYFGLGPPLFVEPPGIRAVQEALSEIEEEERQESRD